MSLRQVVPNNDDGLLDRLRAATVGRYEIHAELGRGRTAAVYLAHDLTVDRQVAIKALLPELAMDVGAVVRFRREARFAATLNHPGIVPVFCVGESLHPPYFVMKFVAGRALDSVLRSETAQPLDLVRAVLQQVGSALDYAHFRSITHGDVRPANVMLDDDGSIALSDFGVAKTADASALATAEGDQHALGCIAYEMLARKHPFERRTSGGGMQLMTETVPLREIVPECPSDLADIIHRMIDGEPKHRFPSLAAMVHALGVVEMDQQRLVANHISRLARSGKQRRLRIGQFRRMPSPALQENPSGEPTTIASIRRSPPVEKWRLKQRVLITLSLLAALAFLIWSLTTPRR